MRCRSAAMRSWKHCLWIALAIAPSILCADTIALQVACSADQAGTVSESSCSLQDSNYDAATEQLTVSATRPESLSGYFAFELSNGGMARGGSGASASANVDLSFRTDGPKRPGYLEVIPTLAGNTTYSITNLSFSIGALDGACYGLYCSFSTMRTNFPDLPGIYDFTLGDPFSLDVNYSSILDAGWEDGLADAGVDFTLQFRLFESDGVTPVAINPEPGTWILCVIGVLVAFALASRTAIFR